MVKLSAWQLKDLLRWASRQKDKKGRSLLERARESLETGSYLKYNTEVEVSDREFLSDGSSVVYWDCDCPYAQKRNKPCKHVIGWILIFNEEELRKSRKWAKWFDEWHEAQIERAVREFDKAF